WNFKRSFRLPGISSVRPINRRGQRDIHRARAEAISDSPLLLWALQQILNVDFGGFAMFGCHPVPLYDPDWMIAPKRPFLGIDSDDGEWQIASLGIRLDHHIFIEHGCGEILRAVGEHLPPEETGRAAIVHN